MFVYFILFVASMVGGMLYGKNFVNKKIVQYAMKAGCTQGQAESIYYLIQNGKKIPEDVQIISYDGFFGDFKDSNVITCVEQPVEEIAKKCINILIDLINKKKPDRENIIKSKFVIKQEGKTLSCFYFTEHVNKLLHFGE